MADSNRNFLNAVTRGAAHYTPGEQVNEPGWIKLNTNESPLPPSPNVFRVMAELVGQGDILRKYSHPLGEPLLGALADYWKLSKEHLIVTNGSDEALTLICRATLGPERPAVFPAVTYSLYGTLVTNAGASYTEVPMVERIGQPYGIDIDALAKFDGHAIFLANPNAITGEYTDAAKLAEVIAASNSLWVVDEAYNDFAGPKATMMQYIEKLQNLIVTRTFSKTHALAGLRVGYLASGNRGLIQGLLAHKDSYNEDALATRLAAAALADTAWHERTIRAVLTGREFLRSELTALGFTCFDSEANYILAREPKNLVAPKIVQRLRDYKILVRHYAGSQFADCIRFSVGAEGENAKLIGSLKEILRGA
ncbi:pyridoxal phosphate-dependent aminotransferase [Turneriella parva]|uniref:histidinol-phosphate transaminase n=1 Tax=Turneriella parva (strain ATCC BAA-1111 / DSM 21527 / NCTC 11395 / H) TaxID=869212 RepID=I4BBH0_TURPD|nr:histidinol-phosphate transaminase [Turneriella parva]AFM14627.1 histidinol phosphate aminotransferase apoenzyme [Turneriella parva DSM 21527]